MKRKFILTSLALTFCMGMYAEQPVTIKTDSMRRIDLEEVMIHATKTGALLKDLPNRVEVVTKRQIEASGINNLTDLLKNFVNVDVIEYPGYNSYFSIRGFKPTEGKYTTVLIDGVPAGTTNMATLSLGDVEQVEVLKGPFSAMYGSDAMGGVVNIVTKRNKDKLTGGIKVAAGSYQTSKGAFHVGGRIYRGLSFDASFDYTAQARNYKIGDHNLLHMSATDKAILGKDTYGIKMNGSRHSGIAGKGRIGYDFGENWSLNFTEIFFVGKDLPTGGNVWGANGLKKKDVTRYTEKLELNGKVNNHNLFFAPHYSTAKTDTYTADTDTAYVYSGNELNTYGFTVHDNLILGKQRIAFGFDNNNEVSEITSFKARGEIKAPYQPRFRNTAWGIFLQSNLKLFKEKLDLSVGLRYDYIDFKLRKTPGLENEEKSESYNTFNPNIGAKYNIYGGMAVHASFGTAFSMTDAYQKAGEFLYSGTLTVGNPDLDPEKSRTLDAGLTFSRPELGVNFDFTYFYTWNDDLIVEEAWTDEESGQKYKTFKNADKAKKSGMEIMASYDFGRLFDSDFALKLYGNLTWMFTYQDQTKGVWNKTLSVRKQNANFGLDFLHQKGFSARLNGRFAGHRIEKNFIGDKYRPTLNDLLSESQPGYWADKLIKHPQFMVFDFSASCPLVENVSVGLNINNLFDENYTEKDGYNMPGRNFQVRAAMTF